MSNTFPHDREELMKAFTRRYFFKQAGIGLGASALSLLLRATLFADRRPAAGCARRPDPIRWPPNRRCFPPRPRA